MPFTFEMTQAAWNRADRRCECTRPGHDHEGRCNRALVWENRCYDGLGGWEQRHTDLSRGDSTENCEIVYHDCFRRVRAAEKSEATKARAASV